MIQWNSKCKIHWVCDSLSEWRQLPFQACRGTEKVEAFILYSLLKVLNGI